MPAYSPELNPIEILWGKIKAKVKARISAVVQEEDISKSEFEAFIKQALEDVSPAEANKALGNSRAAMEKVLS